MTTLHSFGDSFTYGYTLSDCPPESSTYSNLTYAALYAKFMKINYKCHAIGGSGNNQILRQIKHAEITQQDTVFVMWSYAQRYALMLNQGYYTLGLDEHKWWWTNVDQSPEQCLNRTTDFILAGHQILNKIGCKYVFLCNNIELQNEMQYNSKWLNDNRWFFLPENHEMLNHTRTHPSDEVHNDVFNRLKENHNV